MCQTKLATVVAGRLHIRCRPQRGSAELRPAALSSDTNDQWRCGDDAAWGLGRSSPTRNGHSPDTPTRASPLLCHGTPATTYKAFRPPQPPWGAGATVATRGRPGRTTQNWLARSRSPGSSHRATARLAANPQCRTTNSGEEKPRGTLLLYLFFSFFRSL